MISRRLTGLHGRSWANDFGLRDENGADSDWIEIHNPNPFAIDLGGYDLTDDISNPPRETLLHTEEVPFAAKQ
jgi:hypothetical protein